VKGPFGRIPNGIYKNTFEKYDEEIEEQPVPHLIPRELDP
jgi:hypothetical protein